jgi:hypothetical protein
MALERKMEDGGKAADGLSGPARPGCTEDRPVPRESLEIRTHFYACPSLLYIKSHTRIFLSMDLIDKNE